MSFLHLLYSHLFILSLTCPEESRAIVIGLLWRLVLRHFRCLGCTMSNDIFTNEFERIWTEAVVTKS
jgi:hypothetical protein